MKKVIKDVLLRLKHRFWYWLAFSFICLITIGIFFDLGICSARDFFHDFICLSAGFLFAILFLPERTKGPND